MTHFIYGVILAHLYPRLAAINFRETRLYTYRYPIYLLIFFLFSLRHLRLFIPAVQEASHQLWVLHIRWEHFSGIAAAMILAVVIMSKPAQRFLERPSLLFLGRISYSIYLIHWVLIIAIMDHWTEIGTVLGEGYLRFWTVLALFVPATLLFAAGMYRYLERPFIRLNKRWRKRSTTKKSEPRQIG